MNESYTTLVMEGFTAKQKPSNYLTNKATKTVSDQTKVELDSRSVKNIIAVDVKKGTGGRPLDLSGYKTVEFDTPEYNVYTPISMEELDKKAFGKTKYEKGASLIELIVDRQQIISDVLRRTEEKQSSDALFTGKITLVDSTIINFNKPSTHKITPTTKWDQDTAKILDDIKEACALAQSDGNFGASTFNLTVADDVLSYVLLNPQFLAQAKLDQGINRVAIGMPEELLTGAVFHGQFSAGPFKINLLSYSKKYEIPTGFGFANEGTSTPYIPNGGALLEPASIRYDRFYGGVYPINNSVLGAQGVLGGYEKQKAEQMPYAYELVENGEVSIIAGVKSRPLFIPTDVNSFITFDSTLTAG